VDDVVKALLLRLAEDLDPDTLAPLADRLEELGDARAGAVRDMHDTARCHPGLVGACCREALAEFSEGPQWHVEFNATGAGADYRTMHSCATPGEAERVCAQAREAEEYRQRARFRPSLRWRVTGPHWPTPPGERLAPPVFSIPGYELE
jgi:hypothetical protein